MSESTDGNILGDAQKRLARLTTEIQHCLDRVMACQEACVGIDPPEAMAAAPDHIMGLIKCAESRVQDMHTRLDRLVALPSARDKLAQ